MYHHFLWIESQHLQSRLARSTTERNIGLALLKHFTQVDLDSLYRLTLGFVNGESPGKNQGDLYSLGNNFTTWSLSFPVPQADKVDLLRYRLAG